jgi:hypothetical protein
MKTEYTVICYPEFEYFVRMINELLEQDWELQGGISVSTIYAKEADEVIEFYHQALTRPIKRHRRK